MFLKLPNLPENNVKLLVADGRLSHEIENSLEIMGIKIIKTRRLMPLYESVSFHPDLQIHHIFEDKIVAAPGVSEDFLNELRQEGFRIITGETPLGSSYPHNIAYNVARAGNFAFHNFKYTDPVLKQELIKLGVELINIKQGYSKCAISVVNENTIITSDVKTVTAACARGLDALLLEQDEKIVLPGVQYGFIGGSSFMVSQDTWALSGDIGTLKSSDRICEFLSLKQIRILSLTNSPVLDYGSFLQLKTY